MAEYLKTASRTAEEDHADVSVIVRGLLDEINKGGEKAAEELAKRFDKWEGPIVATRSDIDAAKANLPEQVKKDIQFAHANVKKFALAQRETIIDTQVEIMPGLIAGQKQIPVNAAGCYVPGGRYAHIASAIMTVTTAKAAGVKHVTACSPPTPGKGIPDSILYAMDLCGADTILNMGGVQAVASMATGLFGIPKADILVGPGNAYVAEAKRVLFGQVGIDMVAGPTDSLVLADGTADPEVVAVDLVGQAEHGPNSPVWLVTDDRALAEAVIARVPALIDDLPKMNADSARAAWRDYADVILCENREEIVAESDRIAPEHLTVMCADLDWYLDKLTNYGSLFLGEETTVAFGDKAAGPNHVLPTSGAARYTGGLFVGKFMKTVTWQRSTRDAAKSVAETTARISRMEGMEGHARSADIRLAKFFPDETFELGQIAN
jgi:sulfopropanediol 3-dehydrogenase